MSTRLWVRMHSSRSRDPCTNAVSAAAGGFDCCCCCCWDFLVRGQAAAGFLASRVSCMWVPGPSSAMSRMHECNASALLAHSPYGSSRRACQTYPGALDGVLESGYSGAWLVVVEAHVLCGRSPGLVGSCFGLCVGWLIAFGGMQAGQPASLVDIALWDGEKHRVCVCFVARASASAPYQPQSANSLL